MRINQVSDSLMKTLTDKPIKITNYYKNGIFSIVHQLPRTENDDKRVSRCLDIDAENNIIIPRKVKEDEGKTFSNRTSIITNTIAEKEEDYLYVVNWWTKANYNNPSKDYVEAEAVGYIQPIEVIVLNECRDIDEVIKSIKEGIDIIPSNCKWLITYQTEQSMSKAALVTNKELQTTNKGYKIADNIYVLPVYQISAEQYIKEEQELKNRIFYKKLFLGEPDDVIQLYDEKEIVQKVLIDISKQKAFTHRGFTKNEWRKYLEVLNSLIEDNVYQRIAENCGCTIDYAQKLVGDFIKNSNQYISYKDVDSQVFKNILENDNDLLAQVSKLLEDQWQELNHKQISEAKQKIKKIKAELLQKSHQVSVLKNEYNSLHDKKENLIGYIENKEKVLNEVDTKLKTKLREMQENTSETLVKMMLNYGLVNQNANTVNEHTKKSVNFIAQSVDKSDFGKELLNYRDMYHLLRRNLVIAGMADKYTSEMACFFYACIQQHESITLAGTNSIAIANAIGVSFFAEVPVLVDLQSPYQSTDFAEIKDLSNRVIIVRNAFSSDWLGHIDELVNLKDKQVIFSVPFFDDLSILPKNIMMYTIPVVTDMLVDKTAGKIFNFGKIAINYQNIDSNVEVEEAEQLQELHLPMFLKNRYDKLFSVAHQIKPRMNFINSQFICAVIPYAYMSGKLQKAMENFDDEEIPDEIKENFEAVFGVTEDD